MSQDTNIPGAPRRPAFEPLSLDGLRWHSRDEIPAGVLVLDYDELLAGAHRDALRRVLASGTPFYLENHGIPEAGTEAAFNAARGFFREPEERKEEMVHPRLPRIIRGYSGYGTGAYENSLNDGKAVNQYAKYAWGPADNVSPGAAFGQTFDAMFAQLVSLAGGIVGCIGEALELDADPQWPNLFDGEDTVLHCQCYYPEKPLGTARMVSHADASVVTLLSQLPAENGHVGLKAELDGEFVGIPAIRDTLLVMVGESFNGLSGGRAKPVIHAVTGPTHDIEHSERSSMPFFLNPRNAFEMKRPAETTHGKFYHDSEFTTFAEYSQNIAGAYAKTEGARV